MSKKLVGRQTIAFENPIYVIDYASVVGPKEGKGPYGNYYDYIGTDPLFNEKTWEQAESKMQKKTIQLALDKAGLKSEDINYLFAGDLLGQLIATTFGIKDYNIPFFGVYGACSTMGETLAIGSVMIDGDYADRIIALTSSHYAGAEKQFRFPLDYGNQRPLSATTTVTGSGAVILGKEARLQIGYELILITHITTGRIVDYGVKDSMNMGACMAPAAADVIYNNLVDMNKEPDYYDKIITGDLGAVGSDILLEILKKKRKDISYNHMDCGIEIYYSEFQDSHSGGSGCGCCAVTLCGYIFDKLRRGEWRRVLFVPTGALLSPTSFNEGESVPGIAHGIVFESRSEM